MFEVLEHLKNPLDVLKQLHEALKKDGVLKLSVPHYLHRC